MHSPSRNLDLASRREEAAVVKQMILLLLLTVVLTGCAGSNDDVIPTFLTSELSDLTGT